MKRLFAFLLACVCALALFGCAGANDDKSDGGPEDDTTPLTETQIEEFKELFASTADVTDETTGEYRYTTSTPVSCFFTSHYDDPRDIDLAEFLRYCPLSTTLGDADVEENLIEMMKAADNVSTGSVTFAARDSEYGGHTIKEGEILALDGGKVVFTDDDVQHAAVKLAKSLINARKLGGKDVSFATIIYGEGVTEEQAEVVRDGIRAKIGDNVDITLVNGGQPVYYYFISIE